MDSLKLYNAISNKSNFKHHHILQSIGYPCPLYLHIIWYDDVSKMLSFSFFSLFFSRFSVKSNWSNKVDTNIVYQSYASYITRMQAEKYYRIAVLETEMMRYAIARPNLKREKKMNDGRIETCTLKKVKRCEKYTIFTRQPWLKTVKCLFYFSLFEYAWQSEAHFAPNNIKVSPIHHSHTESEWEAHLHIHIWPWNWKIPEYIKMERASETSRCNLAPQIHNAILKITS